MAQWIGRNLVSKQFSKRNETEVEEINRKEQIRCGREIEEHERIDLVRQKIRREECREKAVRQNRKREDNQRQNREMVGKIREKFINLAGEEFIILLGKSNIIDKILEKIEKRREEEKQTDN
jgi:hypothetical protein